jgi:hypothetical protein
MALDHPATIRGQPAVRATTYGSIKSILQNGLDRAFAKPSTPGASPNRHANIRGRGYYH